MGTQEKKGTEEPESDNEMCSTGRAGPMHGFHWCHGLSRVLLSSSITWVKGIKGNGII